MKKIRRGPPTKYNWLKIKRDYITNPSMSLPELAKKYDMSFGTLQVKSAKERWSVLRAQVTEEAEKRIIKEDSVNELVEVKRRHLQIGKIMQKVGLEALEKYKYIPRSAKEAREYLVEGIKVEREAFGLNQNKGAGPSVVNIIGQRDPSLDKYVEGVIVEDAKEEEKKDGEK